jgi:hypothetical protein
MLLHSISDLRIGSPHRRSTSMRQRDSGPQCRPEFMKNTRLEDIENDCYHVKLTAISLIYIILDPVSK